MSSYVRNGKWSVQGISRNQVEVFYGGYRFVVDGKTLSFLSANWHPKKGLIERDLPKKLITRICEKRSGQPGFSIIDFIDSLASYTPESERIMLDELTAYSDERGGANSNVRK